MENGIYVRCKEREEIMSRYYDDTIADMNQKLSDAMDANNALVSQGLALQARIETMLATRAHDPELVAAKAELEAVKRENEWHPTSELPEHCGDVLIRLPCEEKVFTAIGQYHSDIKRWIMNCCVVHPVSWRELPKPEAT
jgi:hypothetical protein